MAINLVHYLHDDQACWGVAHVHGISPMTGSYASTAELIASGEADWRAAHGRSPSLPYADVRLLSPVTAPARLLCQGANYRQHMIESGLNPDEKSFNMFFEKSDCSLNAPTGKVRRPAHVSLLDYEIELGLVFKTAITGPVTVTDGDLHKYVFGLVIANDISPRDVQLPQMQFFKGKSYRGFCPVGPYLAVLEPSDFRYLDQLTLTLTVNGEVRQQDSTANLVYKPAETITELSTFSDVAPGDLLLTGTPSGCALRVPPPFLRRVMQLLLNEKKLWAVFKRTQGRRPQYLKPGDTVAATIASADRVIDLGEQRVGIDG